MFWNTIDEKRQELLKLLVKNPPLEGCYLAGGTACALLLGHRISEDFDWFCESEFDPNTIERRLERLGDFSLTVRMKELGTFHANIDEIKLSWLYSPHPLIEPTIKTPELPGLELASLVDLGLMKWAAIAGRGERKDFVDLYELCLAGVEIEAIYNLLDKKFAWRENPFHLLKSLAYFVDAEKSPPLMALKKFDWAETRKFFISKQTSLMRKFGV